MSKKVNITLQNNISDILRRLEDSGFEAYAVGGYVRDALMGRTAGDCDITTSALPEETKAVFSEFRTIDTGIKHGTVTVVYKGESYEITTYRVDGEYADNRHPDSVIFTPSLEQDLARRDFTVNAMAYSDSRGIVDLFFGREDIESKLIRAVGEPTLRFTEDALRMLRALRFASVLDFEISPSTDAAIFKLWHRIESVSAERILVELRKLLAGAGAYRVIGQYSAIIKKLFCGLDDIRLPKREVFERISPELRLIAIFYLSAENPSEAYSDSLLHLRSDRRTERFGTSVLELMSSDLSGDRLFCAVLDYGTDVLRAALDLKKQLDGDAQPLERLDTALSRGFSGSLSELAIDGKDVISLGYSGARVGEILRSLAIGVMNSSLENSRESLIQYIKSAPLA